MEEGELQGDVPRSRSKWERSRQAVWLCVAEGGGRSWLYPSPPSFQCKGGRVAAKPA